MKTKRKSKLREAKQRESENGESKPRESRKRVRGKWELKEGCWWITLGERRGQTVIVRQNRPEGVYILRAWRNGGWKSKSLQTTDKDEAFRRAREVQVELCAPRPSAANSIQNRITLGDLWSRFSQECKSYVGKSLDHHKDAQSHARVLIGHFGTGFDVVRLSQDDVDAFVTARSAGGIVTEIDKDDQPIRTTPGSPRTAEADINWLNRWLIWATTTQLPDGAAWLTRNPLKGLNKPHPKSQMRPATSQDRYEATLKAIDELLVESHDDESRARWWQAWLTVVLAAATGRRLSAIRRLQWNDIDFARKVIHWPAKTDKEGVYRWIPLSDAVAAALLRYRDRRPAVESTWIFPAALNSDQPSDRHLFDDWLRTAEQRAGLPKLKGGLWHPFRRMWAMCRKNMPISDVMEVGGWDDYETFKKYQQPDHGTMLRILEDAPVLRDGVGLVNESRDDEPKKGA
jgi:integrase